MLTTIQELIEPKVQGRGKTVKDFLFNPYGKLSNIVYKPTHTKKCYV